MNRIVKAIFVFDFLLKVKDILNILLKYILDQSTINNGIIKNIYI